MKCIDILVVKAKMTIDNQIDGYTLASIYPLYAVGISKSLYLVSWMQISHIIQLIVWSKPETHFLRHFLNFPSTSRWKIVLYKFYSIVLQFYIHRERRSHKLIFRIFFLYKWDSLSIPLTLIYSMNKRNNNTIRTNNVWR